MPYFQEESRKIACVHCRSNNQQTAHPAQELSSLAKLNQCPWTVRHLDGVEAHCFCAALVMAAYCTHCSNLAKTLSLGLKRCHMQQRQSVLRVSAGTAALAHIIWYCAHTGVAAE